MTQPDIITDDLSESDIEARLAAVQAAFANPSEPEPDLVLSAPEEARRALQERRLDGQTTRFFRPLSDAADEYVSWARNREARVYTGIREFDDAMRGIAPGELALVVGYAHSGKTVLTTEMILHNRKRRICMFTPDETRVLVLIKLACIVHDVNAYDLERDVAKGDVSAIDLVRSTATQHFPNLAVFDDGLDISQMRRAKAEAEAYWRDPTELVIYDYADLLQGAGDDTAGKISALKAWGKGTGGEPAFPLWLLHQSSRTAGANGAKVKIDSGGYGGEQQATFVLGVRRKKNELTARIDELEEKIRSQANPSAHLEEKLLDARYELTKHLDTITFNLVKNKRPPSPLVDDLDYKIDQRTGRVRPMRVETVTGGAAAAIAARQQQREMF